MAPEADCGPSTQPAPDPLAEDCFDRPIQPRRHDQPFGHRLLHSLARFERRRFFISFPAVSHFFPQHALQGAQVRLHCRQFLRLPDDALFRSADQRHPQSVHAVQRGLVLPAGDPSTIARPPGSFAESCCCLSNAVTVLRLDLFPLACNPLRPDGRLPAAGQSAASGSARYSPRSTARFSTSVRPRSSSCSAAARCCSKPFISMSSAASACFLLEAVAAPAASSVAQSCLGLFRACSCSARQPLHFFTALGPLLLVELACDSARLLPPSGLAPAVVRTGDSSSRTRDDRHSARRAFASLMRLQFRVHAGLFSACSDSCQPDLSQLSLDSLAIVPRNRRKSRESSCNLEAPCFLVQGLDRTAPDAPAAPAS